MENELILSHEVFADVDFVAVKKVGQPEGEFIAGTQFFDQDGNLDPDRIEKELNHYLKHTEHSYFIVTASAVSGIIQTAASGRKRTA